MIDSSSQLGSRAWLAGLFAAPRFGYALSGALAVLIFAVAIGVLYLRTQRQAGSPESDTIANNGPRVKSSDNATAVVRPPQVIYTPGPANVDAAQLKVSSKSPLPVAKKSGASDQSEVLFSDVAYSDIEDKDTAGHIEQAQNLLRSIRNLQASDDDEEIDVSYEKAMSRRLLNENVVLRRDAEMSGKFPAKTLLGDLEPILIDIANLPDKTTPTELRAIKDRVQKTEIVAALQGY